jgi:uncharacterized protein (TIGR03083 family)
MDEVSHYLGHIQEATGRLLATSAALTDAQAREPSLLPGWTRGHVFTHIARNADGMVNLLRGACTGTPIPIYPSTGARDDDIMAGADRPAVDLATDVRESAVRGRGGEPAGRRLDRPGPGLARTFLAARSCSWSGGCPGR